VTSAATLDSAVRSGGTGYRYRMGTDPDRLPFDAAFDAAFAHLSQCRVAYEHDPRDPARFAALGAARAALEDARVQMNAERNRLGLAPREVKLPPGPHADAEDRETWQGTYGD
jgi:hypothetical protein